MAKQNRILIVDDDENIRRVQRTILEDEGFIVETADTATAGIAMSESSFFNLALIDVRLPDMEGIELLSKLKVTTPKMRKIIVTGFPTLQNAVASVNKGADAYILKPFDTEKMLSVIEEQLKKQDDEKAFSETKVAEFIEARVKEFDAKTESDGHIWYSHFLARFLILLPQFNAVNILLISQCENGSYSLKI